MSRWRGQRGQRPGSPAYLTGTQGPGCLPCKAGGARGREDSIGPVALRKGPSAVRAGPATFGLSGLAKPNIFFFFFFNIYLFWLHGVLVATRRIFVAARMRDLVP